MRNAQQLLRRIVLVAVLSGTVAVPVALAMSADPFGPIEVADPTYNPKPLFNDDASVLGVDGSGNALLATLARNAQSDDQLAVLERCGSAPVMWQRTLLGTPSQNFLPIGLKVARDGTAVAIWRISGAGSVTHYSAVRPPGGALGRAAADRRRPRRHLRPVRDQRHGDRDRDVGGSRRRPAPGPRSGPRAARGARRRRSPTRRATSPSR